MVLSLSPLPTASVAKITVPTDFPTLQTAIDVASAGDTIKVIPGTYTDQITISKSLTFTGAGAKSTVINTPAALDTDVLGLTYIVGINNAAKVIVYIYPIKTSTSADWVKYWHGERIANPKPVEDASSDIMSLPMFY